MLYGSVILLKSLVELKFQIVTNCHYINRDMKVVILDIRGDIINQELEFSKFMIVALLVNYTSWRRGIISICNLYLTVRREVVFLESCILFYYKLFYRTSIYKPLKRDDEKLYNIQSKHNTILKIVTLKKKIFCITNEFQYWTYM